MSRPKRVLLIIVTLLAASLVAVYFFSDKPPYTSRPNLPGQNQNSQNPKSNDSFNKDLYPIDEPGGLWWIVGKDRPLPAGYVPPELKVPNVSLRLSRDHEQMQLEPQTTEAIERMFKAAQADGINLVLSNGYRSEVLQRQYYNSYVERDGQAAADRYSAKPGSSEHQTGMAADITTKSEKCHLQTCFADMPEGHWLAQNAQIFGFIIRYPESKEHITGYLYEPWHLRYVGTELAKELHRTAQTMEEFFNL